MSYLVLARKYRPRRFADLVGQEHVARTLANAFALERIHHAYLFTGSRGVGKTSTARILAMALSCEKGPTADPCGTCEACKEIASGQSVDVVEIDGASNRGIDDARALREGTRYAPAKRRKKVYIIDEVHMLTTEAFNALLKTLEEPPPFVVFILATTEVHKIPATIMSRVQRYDFKLVPTGRLAEHLGGILQTEGIKFEAEAIRTVARQAAGSVRDGLSLLDQIIAYVGDDPITPERVANVLGLADRRVLADLARAVIDRDTATALRTMAAALDRGVDLRYLMGAFLAYLHDMQVATVLEDPSVIVEGSPEEIAEARELGRRAPAGLLGSLFDRWARLVDESSRSQTPRLLVEMALVDLCAMEPLLPLGDLLQRLEELEGRLAGGGTPGAAGGPPRARPAAPSGRPVSASAAPPSSWPAPGEAAAAAAPKREPVGVPMAAAENLSQAWQRVLAGLVSRPSLVAALDHADVTEPAPGQVSLVFGDKFLLDQAERSRADIERMLAQAFGRPTTVTMKVGAVSSASAAPVVPSTVSREAGAADADRRRREAEARAHPIVQKAQDLFGVTAREIKT